MPASLRTLIPTMSRGYPCSWDVAFLTSLLLQRRTIPEGQEGMAARSDPARPEVLVIDDERPMRDALMRALELAGFEVDLAVDGEDGLRRASVGNPDLVILDLLMPRTDGLEVCRRLRRRGDRTPVLMLTARDAVASRVEGLEAGADDYLVKPFALEELLARIRALLRRSGTEPHEGPPPVAGLVMDSAARTVRRGNRELR